MEKEYYIDHVKNNHSVYDKLEELAQIAGLPITFSGSNLKYGFSNMKKSQNTYYYQKDSRSIFIFLEESKVRLAYFDGSSTQIYDVDLEHENTFSYYEYSNGKFIEININSQSLSLTSSNNITTKFKSILDELSVKVTANHNKNVEYCSLEFTSPKLIEDEKRISEPTLYIPECKVAIVDKNSGRYYSSTKDIFSMTYQENAFKLTPSIFKSDLLSHFSITNIEKVEDKRIMNPKDSDDITKLLSPLRLAKVKSITEEILLNPNSENRTKYFLRYYDEIIHALGYFQNEDPNKFYVFEDDLNRLQLK